MYFYLDKIVIKSEEKDMDRPNDDTFTELWIGVKQYGNESLFYDTDNKTVGVWKSKITDPENLTEEGNLLRGIENKTIRR
jgi:hypothetical protein